MEKILNIDGKQVKFKSTGAYLLRYKAQFGRDAIKDMIRLTDSYDVSTNSLKVDDAFDLDIFYNLIWVLAKTADPSIPPAIDWLDGFEEFPLSEIIPEVMDLIMSCMQSSIKKK